MRIGGPDGLLALSERGRIVRLDQASARPEVETVAEDLNRPYGIAFHRGRGDLYVGERHQVVRLQGPGFTRETVVIPSLPTGGHWTREIVFGADSMLCLSVGSSCNLCVEKGSRRAAVSRYWPGGSNGIVVASGLCNSAGFAVNPTTGVIWASQNERDNRETTCPQRRSMSSRSGPILAGPTASACASRIWSTGIRGAAPWSPRPPALAMQGPVSTARDHLLHEDSVPRGVPL